VIGLKTCHGYLDLECKEMRENDWEGISNRNWQYGGLKTYDETSVRRRKG
jgi:hypothetical protein